MRPTKYTVELGDEICSRISEGESLAKICRDDHMPHPSNIYRWLRSDELFRENYREAKDNQAEYFVEQTLIIPDEEEDVARAKLKVDVRKWAASKYKPKKYGDKMHLAGDDENPVVTKDVSVKEKFLSKLTVEQLEAIKAESADS